MRAFLLASVPVVCFLMLCESAAGQPRVAGIFSKVSVVVLTEKSMKVVHDVYGDGFNESFGAVEILPCNETLEVNIPARRRERIQNSVMDFKDYTHRLVMLHPKASVEDWEQLHQLLAFHAEYRTKVFVVAGSEHEKAFQNSLRFQEPGNFITILLGPNQFVDIRESRDDRTPQFKLGRVTYPTRNLIPAHIVTEAASFWVYTPDCRAPTEKSSPQRGALFTTARSTLKKIKNKFGSTNNLGDLPEATVGPMNSEFGDNCDAYDESKSKRHKTKSRFDSMSHTGSRAVSQAVSVAKSVGSVLGLVKEKYEANREAVTGVRGSFLTVYQKADGEIVITTVNLQRLHPYNIFYKLAREPSNFQNRNEEGLKLIFTREVTAGVQHCSKQTIEDGLLEDKVVYGPREAGKRAVIVSSTETSLNGGEMERVAITGQTQLLGKPGYPALAVVENNWIYSVEPCELKKLVIQSSVAAVAAGLLPKWAAGIVAPAFAFVRDHFTTLLVRYHRNGLFTFGDRGLGEEQRPFHRHEDTVGLLVWIDTDDVIVTKAADRVVRVELSKGNFDAEVTYTNLIWCQKFLEIAGPMQLLRPRHSEFTGLKLRKTYSDADASKVLNNEFQVIEDVVGVLTRAAGDSQADKFVIIGRKVKERKYKALMATGEIKVRVDGTTKENWYAKYSDGTETHVVMKFRGTEAKVFKIEGGALVSLQIGKDSLSTDQCKKITEKMTRGEQERGVAVMHFGGNTFEFTERVLKIHVMQALGSVKISLKNSLEEAHSLICTAVAGICTVPLPTGGSFESMSIKENKKNKIDTMTVALDAAVVAAVNDSRDDVHLAIMMNKDLSKARAVSFAKTINLLVPAGDVASVRWEMKCGDDIFRGHFTVDASFVVLPRDDGCKIVGFKFVDGKTVDSGCTGHSELSSSSLGLDNLNDKTVKALTVLVDDAEPEDVAPEPEKKKGKLLTKKTKGTNNDDKDLVAPKKRVKIVAFERSITVRLPIEPLELYVRYRREGRDELSDLGKVVGAVNILMPIGTEPIGMFVGLYLVQGSGEVLKYAFQHNYDVELKHEENFRLEVLKKSVKIYFPNEIKEVVAKAVTKGIGKQLTMRPSNGIANLWISTRWTLESLTAAQSDDGRLESFLPTEVLTETAEKKTALGVVVGWNGPKGEQERTRLAIIGIAFEVVKIELPGGTKRLSVTYLTGSGDAFSTDFPILNGTVDLPLPEGGEILELFVNGVAVDGARKHMAAASRREKGLVIVSKENETFSSLYMEEASQLRVLLPEGITSLEKHYICKHRGEETGIVVNREGNPWVDAFCPPRRSADDDVGFGEEARGNFEEAVDDNEAFKLTLKVGGEPVKGLYEHVERAAGEGDEPVVVEIIKLSDGSAAVLKAEGMVLLPDGSYRVVVMYNNIDEVPTVELIEHPTIAFDKATGLIAVPVLEKFRCSKVVVNEEEYDGACDLIRKAAADEDAGLVVVFSEDGILTWMLMSAVKQMKVFLPHGVENVYVEYTESNTTSKHVRGEHDRSTSRMQLKVNRNMCEMYVGFNVETKLSIQGHEVKGFTDMAKLTPYELAEDEETVVSIRDHSSGNRTAEGDTLMKLQISTQKDSKLVLYYGSGVPLVMVIYKGTSIVDLPLPNNKENINYLAMSASGVDDVALADVTAMIKANEIVHQNIISYGNLALPAKATPINIRLPKGKHDVVVVYDCTGKVVEQTLGIKMEGSFELLVPVKGTLALKIGGIVVNGSTELMESGRTHFSVVKAIDTGGLKFEILAETPVRQGWSWMSAFHEVDGERHVERSLRKRERLSMFFADGSEDAKSKSWYKSSETMAVGEVASVNRKYGRFVDEEPLWQDY
eukprot:GHVS01005790.1.p1 GENE.GHVS01005790.1~~GHVS01005790.1.p1  ORF type:complete len:1845 (+),score=193.84 GHVS01005790.1:427-5961(+)